jgi:hypothetical protein
MDVSIGGGRVVFLPALVERIGMSERSVLASKLVAAIRNATLLAAEDEPPHWLNAFSLPGIESAQRRMDEAEQKIEAIEADLSTARNEYRGIDRYRRLLWQEGKYGLELPLRDALTLLGLRATSRPDDPAAFSLDGEAVLMEAEGSTGAVGLVPHYRLRERLEGAIAAEGKRSRGLLVINGQRGLPPAARPQQYEESLRVAAESMRYCLVESTQIYDAVRRKLEEEAYDGAAFCRALIATEGLYRPAPESLQSSPAGATAEEETTTS